MLDPSLNGLQQLINTAYCAQVGLLINASKTDVMCFGLSVAPRPAFSCSRSTLEFVDEVKYLGVLLSSSVGLAASLQMLLGKHSAAGALLTRQLAALQAAESLNMRLRFYNACVPPAGSYACKFWSTPSPPRPAATSCQQLQAEHIRRVLRLSPSVHEAMVKATAFPSRPTMELQSRSLSKWSLRHAASCIGPSAAVSSVG